MLQISHAIWHVRAKGCIHTLAIWIVGRFCHDSASDLKVQLCKWQIVGLAYEMSFNRMKPKIVVRVCHNKSCCNHSEHALREAFRPKVAPNFFWGDMLHEMCVAAIATQLTVQEIRTGILGVKWKRHLKNVSAAIRHSHVRFQIAANLPTIQNAKVWMHPKCAPWHDIAER